MVKTVKCVGCGVETEEWTCINPVLDESGHPFHLDVCPNCLKKYEEIQEERNKEIDAVDKKYNQKLIDNFDFSKYK